jgi:hypothetical protein
LPFSISLTEKEDCFFCVAEIAGTVAGCIAGGWTGVGIVGCVAAAIGTGDLSRLGGIHLRLFRSLKYSET